ncbi:MAG: fatty acid oxidation complex subunit alpha FadB [Moraxellaceae bacterium]|nr:fatty acid oxidation complex subunit alpha FadB [Moraxellaceae bacterium]
MIYSGSAISVSLLSDGIAELKFDLANESVNKFDRTTLGELAAATDAIKADKNVKGVIVTSGKGVFIVGADITEFGALFSGGEEQIAQWVVDANKVFAAFEDLPVPTVAAINGFALGGGFEMTLACDYRVMSTVAKVGLPETKLGIMPGFGGTVRLPRVIGIDNAVEWIAAGAEKRPEQALKDGAVDSVVTPELLQDGAIALVKQAIAGKLDWKARREEKLVPVKLNNMEQMMAFNTANAVVAGQAGPNYPAPKLAVQNMQAQANSSRDEAIATEARFFAKAAVTPQANALVGLFLADQAVKKAAKKHEKGSAKDINMAAVLGAGIMGGGIAYQTASKGTPIIMKDIASKALDLGMGEATKLLSKQVERGRLTPAKMGETLSRIRPTLNYGDFKEVDIIIEAVVENPKVKAAVLSEVEGMVKEDTILASNTSTISISFLAESLKRPENFVGMHFFNPVHMMPLVEVIRGKKSSEAAVAATVKLAGKMGKTAIVVNDCPGFFVNRVLFPYFGGFDMLVRDGADFQAVDKVMEKFGWPMGPAYLLDVVGIDTGVHAAKVMADGFPERMKPDYKSGTEIMFENNRFGQKNGKGYYVYEQDKKGKPKKVVDQTTYDLLKPIVADRKEFDADEIIARCMIPLVNEVARCLEENIVASPAEADMALIMGIGFPPFRGGACRYVDQMGAATYVALCEKFAHLGKAYEAPQLLKDMAAGNKKFFG